MAEGVGEAADGMLAAARGENVSRATGRAAAGDGDIDNAARETFYTAAAPALVERRQRVAEASFLRAGERLAAGRRRRGE